VLSESGIGTIGPPEADIDLFWGANLLQSAFSNWCPMMAILRKAGVRG
jgi:hypothetical protein